MESVSWSVSLATSWPLRYVSYVVFGLFGGLAVLISLILVGLGIARYSHGDPRLLIMLFVLGAVGGVLVALYVGPSIRDAERTPAMLAIQVRHLDRRWLAVTSLASAAALWYLATVSVLAAFAVVIFDVVALFGLYVVATNEGQVDPASGTLTYRGRDIDLDAVRHVSTYTLGPLGLVRVSLDDGASGSRTLLLPAGVARTIRQRVNEHSSS